MATPAITLFCWTFLLSTLLLLLPATLVVARLGPGATSTETISTSLQQISAPGTDKAATLRSAKTPAAHTETQSFQTDFTTPQEDSIMYNSHQRGTFEGASSRRWLVGPGSSPPTCRMKCGLCQPCKPVHIAIGSPHGVISETEYYPEVWRCQCGNQLYMP